MSRIWKECIAPKFMHDTMGVYHGQWMPEMDKCWYSDDGYQVTSRLLITGWGKIEHAAITKVRDENGDHVLTNDGSQEIPWSVKQEIKNEVFGENRVAVEVFPMADRVVDVLDVYHLWVFPKNVTIPIGIHPTKDKKMKLVNRGCPGNPNHLLANTAQMLGKD